jgi:hypothetical protein
MSALRSAAGGSTPDLSGATVVEATGAIAPAAQSAVAESPRPAAPFAAARTTANAQKWFATGASTVRTTKPFQPTPATSVAVTTARNAALDAVLATAAPKRAAADLAWAAAFQQQQQGQNWSRTKDKPTNMAIDAVLARFGE